MRTTMAIPSLGLILTAFLLISGSVSAQGLSEIIGQKWSASDTFVVGEEPNEDARACLQAMTWPAGSFEVTAVAPATPDQEDALFLFPSPLAQGDAPSSRVVMEAYLVADENRSVVTAPAVVVLHESGRRMPIGRMIARGFRQRGVHAFMVQMPGYGLRRSKDKLENMVISSTFLQGTTDVRRAHDAIIALPFVKDGQVSLQGTSLGGFVASLVAGMDQSFDNVFLLLSGGDVYEVLKNGTRDAAAYRKKAAEFGVSDEELRKMAYEVEPNRLAHRLNPERTWLYSGVYDQVVPLENAKSFAKAARLPESNHILLLADHFTGIVVLPVILDRMSQQILTGTMDSPTGSQTSTAR